MTYTFGFLIESTVAYVKNMFRLIYSKSRPFLIYAVSPVYRKSSTTGVTSKAGTVYPSGAHQFTPVGFFFWFFFAEFVFFNM